MQRPWRSTAYLLVSRGLLSLHSYTTPDGMPSELGPPTTLTNLKKKKGPQANLVGAFLN